MEGGGRGVPSVVPSAISYCKSDFCDEGMLNIGSGSRLGTAAPLVADNATDVLRL